MISSWGSGYHYTSAAIHLVAAIIATFWASPVIFRHRANPPMFYAFFFYLCATVFLFMASATFHLLYGLWPESPSSLFCHRLDHMGIGVYFVATLTLMHSIYMKGWWRWGFVRWVWLVVLPAIFIRASFANKLWGWTGFLYYVFVFSISWVSVFRLIRDHGFRRVWPIIAGASIFIIAGTIERLKFPPVLVPDFFGPHEWFHMFVNYAVFHMWYFMQKDAIELVEKAPAKVDKDIL